MPIPGSDGVESHVSLWTIETISEVEMKVGEKCGGVKLGFLGECAES